MSAVCHEKGTKTSFEDQVIGIPDLDAIKGLAKCIEEAKSNGHSKSTFKYFDMETGEEKVAFVIDDPWKMDKEWRAEVLSNRWKAFREHGPTILLSHRAHRISGERAVRLSAGCAGKSMATFDALAKFRGKKVARRMAKEFVLETIDEKLPFPYVDDQPEMTEMEKQSFRAFMWSGRCPICMRSMPIDFTDIDRILPGSKGGRYVPNNCRVTCSTCNRVRSDSDMTDEQVRTRTLQIQRDKESMANNEEEAYE